MIEANKGLFSSPSTRNPFDSTRETDRSHIITNIFPIFLRFSHTCHRNKFSPYDITTFPNSLSVDRFARGFINRWKLVISGWRREEEREKDGDSSLNGWMDNARHVPRARTSASFRAYAFIGAKRGYFCRFVYAREGDDPG